MMKEKWIFDKICLACLVIAIAIFSTQIQSAETIHFDDFCALSTEQQKATLADAFRKRFDFSKNLSYHSTVTMDIAEHIEGAERTEGKMVRREGQTQVFSYWQLGDDYKLVQESFQEDKSRIHKTSAEWNAQDGVYKNMYEQDGLNRTFGRVDTEKNGSVMLNDDYAFWLSAGSTEMKDISPRYYLFPLFLEFQDTWNITTSAENKTVEISFTYDPWPNRTYDTKEGILSALLDPEKGYMPVRISIQQNFTLGGNHWTESVVTVQESQLVRDMWMPMVLVKRTGSDVLQKQVTILTTTIDRIEQGNVTPADVKITFPEGCEITDAISGDAYTIGADGKPIESTIVPLYGTDEISLPPEKRSVTGYIITLISILLVACIFGYIHFRKKQRLHHDGRA